MHTFLIGFLICGILFLNSGCAKQAMLKEAFQKHVIVSEYRHPGSSPVEPNATETTMGLRMVKASNYTISLGVKYESRHAPETALWGKDDNRLRSIGPMVNYDLAF